ncbi:glycosyltransferase family 4 protein [Sulfurimonas sp.]|uniref:MraY family glycosyltransferase n=1 Tax=Sulfurimonas sp. TaxID=2022749 RepID=UPI0025E78D31|nr:glycosyltransferase family 4 protein [Sulfurimonas sp.]MDD5156716.1 glycosyltransferase family 4 protein [Sulfurimonas sp.]
MLTYFIKEYAIRKSLIAHVNERSSHVTPTPHGGGVAIAITWFVGLIYLYANNQIEQNFFYALMFGVIISVISYLDDLYELPPKIRIFVQSGVALGGLYVLGGLHGIDFGFFSVDNQIIVNMFAFLLIIWFINLYNFLDGIDGYAGSEAIFLSIAGFLFFGGNHFILLAVAVLGFLFWNWHKAKIFMGDVGSTLLGYTVAIFTIYYANQNTINLWIWVTLFALFWFDATITLFRRYKSGEKLYQAHKKHAYQRLVQLGWSHKRVVLWSIIINTIVFSFVYIFSAWIALPAVIAMQFYIVKYIDGQTKSN